MDQFLGATATDTISNMIGTGTIDNQTGPHWRNQAAGATVTERKLTVEGLQYRINAGVDSPRVVGAPVMAYSPRSKTNETPLDKKLHGVIDANGNVTELPQYASWQWALKFTKAGVNDVDSYFELVSFIGGPAAKADVGGVTEMNNNWPATQAELGNNRDVFATQAIRHLGLGTVPTDDVLAANLISRGGYIQDYQRHGIDPVAVILPGYITVSNGDTLYTGLMGSTADDYNLTTPIKVGTEANKVKAGTYPVKRGFYGTTAGTYGACAFNQMYSCLSQIWTPGYVEFGHANFEGYINCRSLTFLGTVTDISSNWWGYYNCGNYDKKLASLYYNASDTALKAAFNANTADFKTNNQSLIDTPTRLQPILANTFDPIISLPPSSYYPILHHQK